MFSAVKERRIEVICPKPGIGGRQGRTRYFKITRELSKKTLSFQKGQIQLHFLFLGEQIPEFVREIVITRKQEVVY